MSNIKPNERVRSAMVMSGFTQETMAKAIGLSYSTFSLKLNGKRDFTLPECNRIAKKVKKTLDDLFFDQDVPK